MNDPENFARLLRERRKALRLTQAELAARVGLSFSAIQKLEGGQRHPSRQVAELLAGMLYVDERERTRFVALLNGGPEEESFRNDKSSSKPPSNLPAELTTLVGRDRDIDDVTAMLRQSGGDKPVRLLTLTGPPGIGKTRLALEAASRLLFDFEDGVFLIALAPIQNPTLVVQTIAATFGLQDKGNEPVADLLKEYLRNKKLLLVLDNFEHVVAAAADVVELLWSCSQVRILVTSREALHVRGEHRYQVASLDNEDSVRLFFERAQQVEPDFTHEHDRVEVKGVISAICARLEGVPLAIELVAARISLMPPKALLARLEKHYGNESSPGRTGALPLLVGGQRDLPERHRTIRSAIGWSYELLTEDEQRLFRRLGVFQGGFTFGAVEAICNAHSDLGIDVMEGVYQLFHKSLLKPEITGSRLTPGNEGDELCFIMLETIREYALEQLKKAGEKELILLLHAQYFLAIARTIEWTPLGERQFAIFQMLDADYENFRAALTWTYESNRLELAARMAIPLTRYWHIRGYFAEGQDWLLRLIAAYDAAETNSADSAALQVSLRMNAAVMSLYANELWKARLLLEEGVSIQEHCEPLISAENKWATERLAIDLRIQLGNVARMQGDYERAIPLYRECVAASRQSGQELYLANSLWALGISSAENGESEYGEGMLREGLTTARKINDIYVTHGVLRDLGSALCFQGKYSEAEQCIEESLELASRAGVQVAPTWSLLALGYAKMGMCDYGRANELFRESLKLAKSTVRQRVPDALEGLAHVAVESAEGGEQAADYVRAARLLGAAASIRSILGTGTITARAPMNESLMKELRTALGEKAYDEAYDLGRSMNLEGAISYALEL